MLCFYFWHLRIGVLTRLSKGAFYNCTKLTNATIPNSVTKIGASMFYNCCKLTSITIPSGVTKICDFAFYGCSELMSVTIPDNVTTICSSAFYGCRKLTSVTIGKNVASINSDAFSDCCKLVEVINNSSLNIKKDSSKDGKLGYYALNVKRGGTTDIVNENEYLFYTYDNVNYLLGYVGQETQLVLPENYNGESYQIYDNAFENCNNLTSVAIGNGVTSIGNNAFKNCDELTSVTIGNRITAIGYDAFFKCIGLTSVIIPDGVTEIGSSAFDGCSGLTSIVIPDSITSIGIYVFDRCSGLIFNEYDNGLYLGNENNPYLVLVKAKSSNIISCDINEKCKIISCSAFEGCSRLVSVTIPDNVMTIDCCAFV